MGDFLHSLGIGHAAEGSSGSSTPSVRTPTPPGLPSAPAITADTPMTNTLFGQSADAQATPANPYGAISLPDLLSAVEQPAQQAPQAAAMTPSPLPVTPPPVQLPDNQYDSYNPNIPQDVAQTVGTPDANNPADSIGINQFKPKELHGLAAVANFFLGNALGRGQDEDNLKNALQSFTHDPERAIQHVATFDPKRAWAMQQQYLEGLSRDASADKSRAATNVLIDRSVLPQIGGLAMSIAKETDPTKQQALWEKARPRILALGEQYNRDYSKTFPEKFDADAISLAIGQAINPGKQEALAQGETKLTQNAQRIKQGEEKITLQGKDIDSKVARRAAETAQGATNTGLKQQRYSDMKPSVIPTKNGNMEVRGNRGVLLAPDGSRHLFMTNDGHHWIHVNTLPPAGTK